MLFCELIPITAIMMAIYIGERKVSKQIKQSFGVQQIQEAPVTPTESPKRTKEVGSIMRKTSDDSMIGTGTVVSPLMEYDDRSSLRVTEVQNRKSSHLFWRMENNKK